MSDDLFIDDGYTATKTVPAISGLYPELKITYRPALSKERHAYRIKSQSADALVVDSHETELIAKFVVAINGRETKDKEKVARLKPAIRALMVDLVLGYTPEDERACAANLPTG
jgi:hypothetical protein